MAYRPDRRPKIIAVMVLAPVALLMTIFGLYLLWGAGVGL